MGKPDAPQPPNPYQTAAAQTGTNVSTAVANAYLGNVNQVTPDGSLTYNTTGSHQWTDPSTGQTYTIPTFTATQALTPQGQALADQNNATKMNLATMANQQSARVGGLLNTPFDPISGAPSGGNAQNIANVPGAQTSYDPGGNIQTSFGGYGDITKTYGADNFSQDRLRVEQGLMDRLNPQLSKDRAAVEQRLADQGIRYGSQAYASAMDDWNRQSNDARLAVIGQGGQEQQRMMDMAAQQAGFQNAAQQQAYDQSQGLAAFGNQAQAQQNAQNAAAAGFYNAGQGQNLAQQQSAFNAANAQRNQYMQEQYQARNQPLNEIGALMSGSQVQSPNFINANTSQIPTTDIGGLINQNYAQQQGNYNTQLNSWNSVMGGLLGMGAGWLKSDRNSKKNVTRMGSVLASGRKLPVYAYEYKDDPTGARHIGPMAQDVEKIDPSAVARDREGTRYINTARMGSILGAAA